MVSGAPVVYERDTNVRVAVSLYIYIHSGSLVDFSVTTPPLSRSRKGMSQNGTFLIPHGTCKQQPTQIQRHRELVYAYPTRRRYKPGETLYFRPILVSRPSF